MYSEKISTCMKRTRWSKIKRCIKLNDNATSIKKGKPGFNPVYKFDYLYDCLVSNTNSICDRAELDLCGDETTYPFGGFGEAGSGLISRVKKPGISKGGQIVIISDVHHCRIRAYTHRHKLHATLISGVGGTNKVQLILVLYQIDELMRTPNQPCGIFTEKSHLTFDNYFSGDSIHEYCDKNGYGLTMTVNRGRLPKGVPDKYWQKQGTKPSDQRARACRFTNPIVVHRTLGGSDMVFCSFQSTINELCMCECLQ